jgi:1,4-dihydroxy-2-naphthoate polyprenyltransferase
MDRQVAMTRKQLWLRLLLYPGHTLPTAAAPILVGVGLAVRDGVFAAGPALLFLVTTWFVHVAGVLADNHTLISRHPDLPEHPELLNAVAQRTLALSTLALAIAGSLLLGAAFGLGLVVAGGPPMLALALLGVAASLGYHAGPWPYVKHGVADPVFLLMFGVVAVSATYFVQAASLAPAVPWLQRGAAPPGAAWWVGLPVGALVVCVMVIDDIRDRDWDARKGWRTPAVRWGLAFSRAEFTALVALAYAAPPLFWALGLGAGMLLPLLTAPLAWQAVQAVRQLDGTASLLRWTPRVARLGFIYATLLALGLALPAL